MFESIEPQRKIKWRQYWTASLASYGSLCIGMSFGWVTPAIRKLRDDDSPLTEPVSTEDLSKMLSIIVPGLLVGPQIAVFLSRYIGRKWVIFSSSIPLLLGWFLATVAHDVQMLYAARIMWGCAIGMQFTMVPLYIGEIAEDNNRGALITLFLLFNNVGLVLVYAIRPFSSYLGLTATGGILSLFYVPFVWFIPETPLFLVSKGRLTEATEVLQELRGKSKEDVSAELQKLQDMVARENEEPPKIKDLFATKGSVKALGICVFLTMLFKLSSIDLLYFFLERVFWRFDVNRSYFSYGSIIKSAIQLIIGAYAFFEAYYMYDLSSIAFIPIVCLILYVVLFTLGVGPVSWILVAEMFPVKTKCLASGICSFICSLTGFGWAMISHRICAFYGFHTVFWILAICFGIGFVISTTLLPETKGKNFGEIQDMLNNTSDVTKGSNEGPNLHNELINLKSY